jgi:cytochrome b6-f complex iron-sulfur subunit
MSEEIEQDPSENGVPRRTFMKVAVAGMGIAYGAAIAYPVFRFLNSPVEEAIIEAAVRVVTIPNGDKLAKGTAQTFKFGPFPAMLIHHPDGTWSAFSSVCTHLGCTVRYDPALVRITCACHGGQYDPVTGKNIAGPPPKPLTRFDVKVAPGLVTVSRI